VLEYAVMTTNGQAAQLDSISHATTPRVP
jgi:hypothetical protein